MKARMSDCRERSGLLWLAVVMSVFPVANAADGKAAFAQKACASCHGEAGNNPLPGYPKLAGQNEAYLVRQMKDFRSGERSNGLSALMTAYMSNVSDEEIAAIAEYLAAQ